nr:hypothetical protein [uncultured Acetatifactor sp.]
MNLEKLRRARELAKVPKKEKPQTKRPQPERTVRARLPEMRGTSPEALQKEKEARARLLEMRGTSPEALQKEKEKEARARLLKVQGMSREILRREKAQRRSPGRRTRTAPLWMREARTGLPNQGRPPTSPLQT